jgi:hypothetical protein
MLQLDFANSNKNIENHMKVYGRDGSYAFLGATCLQKSSTLLFPHASHCLVMLLHFTISICPLATALYGRWVVLSICSLTESFGIIINVIVAKEPNITGWFTIFFLKEAFIKTSEALHQVDTKSKRATSRLCLTWGTKPQKEKKLDTI